MENLAIFCFCFLYLFFSRRELKTVTVGAVSQYNRTDYGEYFVILVNKIRNWIPVACLQCMVFCYNMCVVSMNGKKERVGQLSNGAT